MSQVTTFMCDRCGADEKRNGHGGNPKNFHRLPQGWVAAYTSGDRHPRSYVRIAHLCPECARALLVWVKGEEDEA